MASRRSRVPFTSAFVAFLLSSLNALGQSGPTLEKSLASQYALTTATADNNDIVTAGAVLTLRKRGLLAADATNRGSCVNSYKAGTIKPTASCQLMGGKMILGQHVGGSTAVRTFVNGEKVFVTKIDVDQSRDTVTFDLFSDVYNNVRYRAPLRFEFGKGSLDTMSTPEILKAIGEVFTAAPPEAPAETAARPSSSAPPQRPMQQVAPDPPPAAPAPAQQTAVQPDPPPPAPQADPATIAAGDTKEQVIAKLGQPQKILKAGGGKEFYIYKDVKVTFINGKMTDAQ